MAVVGDGGDGSVDGNRTREQARLDAYDLMRSALEIVDGIGDTLVAARLQHAIETLRGDLDPNSLDGAPVSVMATSRERGHDRIHLDGRRPPGGAALP